MAAIVTVLKNHEERGSTRVFTTPTHSVASPQMVKQSHRTPVGDQMVATDNIEVRYAVADVAGSSLPTDVIFSVSVRRDKRSAAATVAAAKVLFREIVASDEFDAIVDAQAFIAN